MTIDAKELKRWLDSVSHLTACQKTQLLEVLSAGSEHTQDCALVESRIAAHPAGPRCGGDRTVRNGGTNGLQRYNCRACLRTFNALTTTSLARHDPFSHRSLGVLRED